MLTRLVAKGFKNLDVDVQFGPLTCIAGPNGVGKSNIFDAIAFLSALAEKTVLDAASGVRGGAGRLGDVRGLFRRVGGSYADEMKLSVDMIIPPSGEDHLGQVAEASITYLRYEIQLRYQAALPGVLNGGIEIVSESLLHLNVTEAGHTLGFPTRPAFRESSIKGRRTVPYISMKDGFVLLHADAKSGQGGGGPRRFRASTLPRTVLSSAENAAEHRTATLARREMLSWTQLHLEPSALRAPDDFTAPGRIQHDGKHMPASLYRLIRGESARSGSSDVTAKIANRISNLIERVRSVDVDVDEKRQVLSLVMTDRSGTSYLADSLSDGTLRFLALAIMYEEVEPRALICLEEPENGMHPARIPALLALLRDLAVDAKEKVGPDNPLRQVIINTHSPTVVAQVLDDELLMAKVVPTFDGSELAVLLPLSGTWRVSEPSIAKGDLMAYLDPLVSREELASPVDTEPVANGPRPRRVMDRPDLQLSMNFEGEESAAE